jgi:hypothetical protein
MALITQSNPDYDKLEVVKSGTTSIAVVADDGGTVTITHNLGFIPIVMAFVSNDGTVYQPLPYTVYTDVTITGTHYWLPTQIYRINSVTATDFTITLDYQFGTSNTVTTNFAYYLFQKRASS